MRSGNRNSTDKDSRRRVRTAALIACAMVGIALVAALVLIALFGSYDDSGAEHYVEQIRAEDLYLLQNGTGANTAERQDIVQGQDKTGQQETAAEPVPEQGTAVQAAAADPAKEQAAPAQPVSAEPPAVIPSRVIFVGDSRTVQMEIAVNYDPNVCSFVGESGMGYDWLASTGVFQAEGKLGPYDSAIILNMGVNDLGNVKKYASLINRKAAEWKLRGAAVWYASVNPVNDGYPTVSNEQIRQFNETLRSLLSEDIRWIDTYSYLVNNGYTATDGLHYDKATYQSLYAYYLRQLGLQ